MSSNSVWASEYAIKKIEEIKEKAMKEVTLEQFKKIQNAKTFGELASLLPEHLSDELASFSDGFDRIVDSPIDAEVVEDWGEGIRVDENNNMHVSIGAQCDLTGETWNYEIVLPPDKDEEVKHINLVKKK